MITDADYTIKRLGLVDPSNFTVSVNPISGNIESVGPTEAHNNVNFGQEISNSIAVNLDPAISDGEQVTYEVVLNNGAFDKVVTINRIYGQPTVVLDELGNSTAPNWDLTPWGQTGEDFVSASSSITDSPNAVYANNESSAIVLANVIDLTSATAASLTYQAKWDIENNFDYVQVAVSTTNGLSWIPQCGNYTNNGAANQTGAEDEPVYDGTQLSWVLETIDLSDYIGDSILIRFQLVSDISVQEDGFYFDDLKVNVLTSNLGVSDLNSSEFKLFPNPVTNLLTIQSQHNELSYSIYSIHGQLLRSDNFENGDFQLDFSNYSSGIYMLSLNSNSSSQTFKIVKR